jgi:hypothetical protein
MLHDVASRRGSMRDARGKITILRVVHIEASMSIISLCFLFQISVD